MRTLTSKMASALLDSGLEDGMTARRYFPLAAIAMALVVGCNENNDHGTTPTGGSLAQVEIGGPDAPVASGAAFNIDVKARDAGFSVLHNARVHLVLAPPLAVDGAEVTSGGGNVAFVNGANGATVDYDFGTIDKGSQSAGTIHAHGTLAAGTNNVNATVTAELTSDEVHAGDADASITIIVQQ